VIYGLSLVQRTGRPSSRAVQHYDTYLSLLPSRRSFPEIVNPVFFSSEKYFTNARTDHRKRTVPTVEECNSSVMGFAFGILWDTNDPFTQWQSFSTSSSCHHVASSVCGRPDSESTAEEHGSEPDPSVKQMLIMVPADNSSMDLLASVATGIIEVSPKLRSAAEVMDEFQKKQHLHHQISELEKRRKRAVVFADELSGVVLPLINLRKLLLRPAGRHTGFKAIILIKAIHSLVAKRNWDHIRSLNDSTE